MGKRSKLYLFLFVFILTIGQAFVALASGSLVQKVNNISFANETSGKKVSSAVIYTNDAAGEANVVVKWQWTRTAEDQKSAGVIVSTSNRSVVAVPASIEKKAIQGEDKVVKTSKNNATMESTYVLKLKAVGNGNANIVVKSTDGKKKAVLKVSVKTYASDIYVANAIADDDNNLSINVASNGSLNLGAVVANSDASNKGLKYKVTTKDEKKAVSVNNKGIVKVNKKYTSGTAVITISSADGKVSKDVSVNVAAAASAIKVAQDNKSTKDVLGQINKKNVLVMKTNKSNYANTYGIKLDGIANNAVVYSVNKPAICTVSKDGVIAAKGNGTAVITISHKEDMNKKAKLTVKVSTDVDNMTVAANAFNLVDDNKASVNIGAKVNALASNKKIKYTISRLTINGTTYTDAKTIKKYASVSSKGIVKAKAVCEMTVSAVSEANAKVSKAVTISVFPAIKKVEVVEVSEDGKEKAVKKNAVIWQCVGEDREYYSPSKYYVRAYDKNNNVTSYCDTGLYVEQQNSYSDGVISLYNDVTKRKMVVSAYDKMGTNKSFTLNINVKFDVDEMWLRVEDLKTGSTNILEKKATIPVECTKKMSVDLSKILYNRIFVNTYADISKVEYFDKFTVEDNKYTPTGKAVKKVSLEPGTDKEVMVCLKNRLGEYVYAVAVLKPVTNDYFAKEVSFTTNFANDSIICPVGATIDLTGNIFMHINDEVKKPLNRAAIKYSIADTSVATLDAKNIIKAKKKGYTEIIVKYEDTELEKRIPVIVRTASDVMHKNFSKIISESIKTEDWAYTGTKPIVTLGEDIVDVTFEITDPFVSVEETNKRGIALLMKDIALNYDIDVIYLSIFDSSQTELCYVNIYINDDKYQVACDGEIIAENLSAREAADTIYQMYVDDNQTTFDLNGDSIWFSFEYLEKISVVNGKEITARQTMGVRLGTYMSNEVFQRGQDSLMSEAADKLSEGLTGVESVTYEDNTFVITMNDPYVQISDIKELDKQIYIDALKEALKDSTSAVISVDSPLGNVVRTTYRTSYNTTDEYIADVMDSYFDKLMNKAETFVELDGTKVAIDLAFRTGHKASYEVAFTLVKECYDAMADGKITNLIGDGNFAFGTVAFDGATNAFAVEFKADYKECTYWALVNDNTTSIVKQFIMDNSVKQITVDGVLIKEGDLCKGAIWRALPLVKNAKLGDLAGKTTVVDVVYASNSDVTTKITYVITYTLAEEIIEDDASTEEGAEDETTGDDASNEDKTEGDVTGDDASDEDKTEGDVTGDDASDEDKTEGDVTGDDASDEDKTEGDVIGDDASDEDKTEGDVTGDNTSNEEKTEGEANEDVTTNEVVEG